MRVPEPGFFLKRPKDRVQTAIMMVVRVNRTEILKYYTRESIRPIEWDGTKKRAKEGMKWPEGWEINQRLDKYRLKFKSTFRELIDKKVMPTKALMKSALDKEFFDFIDLHHSGLVHYFDDVIKRMKENKLMAADGKPYSSGTIKIFNTSIKHLRDYEHENEKAIALDGADMEFYYEYLDYFYSKNYSTNAIYNPIKKLKYVLKLADQEGYRVHPACRSGRFVAPSELADKIYLTSSEIEMIYRHEYELFSQIDNVRDRFILACCTGIRFSDYEEINPENIFSNADGEYVRVKSQKTNVVAVIPLNWMARKILLKYAYRLPKVVANTHFNDYLKDIGEDAGLITPVRIMVTRGGKSTSVTKLKWELIQTHTARRSFATNLFLQGFSIIEIMKLTGHKTEVEFLKYIRASSEEVAFKIARDPRFSARNN